MRDKAVLISLAVAAIVVGVLIFVFGKIDIGSQSQTGVPQTASVVQFTPIAQGQHSNVDRRVNYRISSAEQMSELWKSLQATGTPPAIDFDTHEVLAVFAGPESCTKISVVKIEDTSQRVVSIMLAKPTGTCAAKLSISPYEMVSVPVTSLPLTHQDVVTQVNCPKQ